MAGSMQNFNSQFTNVEYFPIPCYMNRKFCFSFGTKYDGSTGNLAKIEMTTYKISMKMSFKNIFDSGFSFRGQFKILINITQRIYYSSFSVAFNIISCFAQAAGV